MTTPTTLRRPALRRLVGHYLEIVLAAVAGMVVLGPAESMLLNPIGWAAIAEMAVAMYAPFLVLFPPLWLGVLSASGLMALGHVLMLFTIAAAMLRRRDQYT